MSESARPEALEKKEWWKYLSAYAVTMGWNWAIVIAALLGGAIMSIIQARGAMIPDWAIVIICISGFAIAGFITWLKQKRITEAQQIEIQTLNDQIQSLQSKVRDDLEIDGIANDLTCGQSLAILCKIRVHNKNTTKTADEVKVEIISLVDESGDAIQNYSPPSLPFILKSVNDASISIHPLSALEYNLFQVIPNNPQTRSIPNDTKSEWVSYFICLAYFSETKEKAVATFDSRKTYRIKLIASARDVVKCEREYLMKFSNEGAFCRFNLTKI